MAIDAPPRPQRSLLAPPPIREVHAPQWFHRLPRWASIGGVLFLLIAASVALRTRQLSGELWSNEAIAVGMASHSLSALPGVLRAGGSAPLYYLLLHFWIQAFGSSASATHALSLVIGLAMIPLGLWLGWSLAGRRAGIFSATLLAFSAFATKYAEEVAPYELLMALSLVASTALIHGFAYRRRRWLWLFGASLALMLYTQASALLYWFGAAVAIALVIALCDDRRGVARDALLCFGGAAVAYLPWLPTTIDQIAHATAGWHYAPLLGGPIPGILFGGDRVDTTLLVCLVVGAVPLLAAQRRRTPEALAFWTLLAAPLAGLALAAAGLLVGPSFVVRYFAVLVAPLTLLGALAAARARLVGVLAIVFCVAFLVTPSSFAPAHKSNMQDVEGELAPLMHTGDWVVVAQPEQTPLAWYYFPSGLNWANTTGRVADPSTMDWNGAMSRLEQARPQATLAAVLASLKPGQRLLFVRPLTEGIRNWSEAWPQLVRRRSAQWSQLLTADVADGTLKTVARAPHNYRSACCVADSAVLYQRT
jgi:predicted membrane protein